MCTQAAKPGTYVTQQKSCRVSRVRSLYCLRLRIDVEHRLWIALCQAFCATSLFLSLGVNWVNGVWARLETNMRGQWPIRFETKVKDLEMVWNGMKWSKSETAIGWMKFLDPKLQKPNEAYAWQKRMRRDKTSRAGRCFPIESEKEESRVIAAHKNTWARWWFQICFIFNPTWGNDLIWLIFFGWVETTN